MKKGIKVSEKDVYEIGKEIENLLNELQTTYNNLVKSKTLICESWQSEAALRYVNNIDTEEKNINKLMKIIRQDISFVNKSTKEVLAKDKQIASAIQNCRN